MLTMVSQNISSVIVASDSIVANELPVVIPENKIENQKALIGFFDKLHLLEKSKTGHLNIVHIGDSHIQADLMTNKTRKLLQQKFGNGGRGFVFPHSIAKTNGSSDVKFSSNANWNAYRNIYPITNSLVGLSGIALSTKFVLFVMEMTIRDPDYFFDNIKIITPNNENGFKLAVAKKIISEAVLVPKKIFHKIQKRETLLAIAHKFDVDIDTLKTFNSLKSDKIARGKTLKIPTSEMVVKTAERSEYIPVSTTEIGQNVAFESEKPLEKIFLIPSKKIDEYNLNGLVLENKTHGILYHNIGVNGSKFMDFNKYPLFFEQLESLLPDLFIISLGTNESFGKFSTEKYLSDLQFFLETIQQKYPNAAVLLTTPPPSLFQKNYPNLVVAKYAAKTLDLINSKNIAVWNLHAQMGGIFGVNQNFDNGLVQPDKIHYTNKGYEMQGQLLFEALMKAYQNTKN